VVCVLFPVLFPPTIISVGIISSLSDTMHSYGLRFQCIFGGRKYKQGVNNKPLTSEFLHDILI
jgi:hypothetical protein